jgi:ribosomal protein L29
MTKARSHLPSGKALRQPGSANAGCVEGADVCELLLAELAARRERLRKLLLLVRMEVESLPVSRTAVRCHTRREIARFSHTA